MSNLQLKEDLKIMQRKLDASEKAQEVTMSRYNNQKDYLDKSNIELNNHKRWVTSLQKQLGLINTKYSRVMDSLNFILEDDISDEAKLERLTNAIDLYSIFEKINSLENKV